MSNKKLEVTVQLEIKDIEALQLHYLMQKKVLVASFIIILLGLFAFSISKNGLDFFSIFPIILFLLVFYFVIKRVSKQQYKTSSTLQNPIKYILDEEGITMVGDGFNSKVIWGKFHKVTETNTNVYLWQSKMMAHILPKRFLKEGDIELIYEIIPSTKFPTKLKK